MSGAWQLLSGVLAKNGLVTAFAFVGITVWLSYLVSDRLTHGRTPRIGHRHPGRAGARVRGRRGHRRIPGAGRCHGVGRRGRAGRVHAPGLRHHRNRLRVSLDEIRKAGLGAAVSLFVGVLGSFVVGAAVAWFFGYRDPVSMTTIGAGAATYIVELVTGTAVGAPSDIIALSASRPGW